jgi:branched-chain amino acid transport system ATP-binding protein
MSRDFLLATDSISMRFGGLTALENVTYTVREGEIRGVIGPNGAGKTTLFNVMSGDPKPTGGKIFLRGEDVTRLSPDVICQKGLSRTFQLTLIFPEMSVYDSVWVGVNSKARRRWNPFMAVDYTSEISEQAQELCRLVGLDDKMFELASNLSYGDQKLLEIAVALSTRPSVLLLDEPTQGVGPNETDNIVEVIKRISKSTTIVLIEHSMDVVLRVCEVVTVLNEGRLVFEGPSDEVCRNEEVQRIYLGA